MRRRTPQFAEGIGFNPVCPRYITATLADRPSGTPSFPSKARNMEFRMIPRPPIRHVAVILAQALLVPPVAVLMAAPAATQAVASTKNVHPDDLRKRAEKGDIAAMWVLQQSAVWYKNPKKKKAPDQRIEFSQDERLKWIRAGVAAGDPYSMEKLARIYGKGQSVGGGYDVDDFSALVSIDYAESARLARAAGAGFRQHKAEFRYSGIDGGEKLEKRAADQETFAQQSDDLSVLLPLAEEGDKEAIWGVYLVHAVANNYPEIWDWLGKSVKAGDPRAIVETWRRHTWQTGYKAWEDGKPNEWLVMAARLGDADAMNSMGNAYAWYTDDDTLAHEWYKKAYEAGSPLAEVGMHLYGDATARQLLNAAEAGDGAAAYRLAQYYLTGEWNGRNTGEYERWMLKAVDLRHIEAQWEWGKRTGSENLIRAAANAGHVEAKAEVADMNLRAAIEARRLEAEQAAETRRVAEGVFNALRTSNIYDKNGISEERLYFALQAAQTEAERELVRAESARRVVAYEAAENATSGYRPMTVTPYVAKPEYKTAIDFHREHTAFKNDLVARLREVVR